MKNHFSSLWNWHGAIDRGPYALIGIVLFLLKHNIDRFIATGVFHRPWNLFNYWVPPTQAISITSLNSPDARLLATLLAIALPFIWVGVILTVQRLHSIGLPAWLAVIFFLPVINLAFFVVLSVVPSRSDAAAPVGRPMGEAARIFDRLIPQSEAGSAAMAILLTFPFAMGAMLLGAGALGNYGWSLFVALPFCQGMAAALLYGYHKPRGLGSCLAVSTLSMALVGLGLLGLALEGVICIFMALPIAGALALMGGTLGYVIQRHHWSQGQTAPILTSLIIFLPILMGAEHASPQAPPTFAVTSSIEINAPPETVWRNVISFAELPPPKDWVFRTGVAYPIRARINGRGPGAVRTCEFSTGPFVEPIEVWDEPRELRFGVSANPEPMQEWTIYSEIHPRHLSGYLVSKQGQFLLTPLPGGRTRLDGTTWYQHHLWPASYWQLWSDAIIHRIHMRVLKQIKFLSEGDVPSHSS